MYKRACTTAEEYHLSDTQAEDEASNKRRSLLEISSKEVDDPVEERANRRCLSGASWNLWFGVEQALEPRAHLLPVYADEGGRVEILKMAG